MKNFEKHVSQEENRPIRHRKTAERFTEYLTNKEKKISKANCSKKGTAHGWFKVDRIEGHRITHEKKNKDFVELKVSWEGYSDPSWERFDGFVKDAA